MEDQKKRRDLALGNIGSLIIYRYMQTIKLTWPIAKLYFFWITYFSRENKVQTFISGSIG